MYGASEAYLELKLRKHGVIATGIILLSQRSAEIKGLLFTLRKPSNQFINKSQRHSFIILVYTVFVSITIGLL